VKTFTEKPELAMAKVFYESGEFFWNSGMFFWSLPSIMQAFDTHMPAINKLFQKSINQLCTDGEADAVASIYAQCRNISIDYAVMEKAENVYVLCADFGWSDIGTWGSLYANQRKDKNRNAVVGNNVFLYDTKGCEININPQKLAVIQGLEDIIVVQTDDVLLICKRDEEQRIKDFVNNVKLEKGDIYI
jgi:mannose-1-phosphate guanylyltransferase